MAVEERRGCGYRRVNGLYLVGPMAWAPCDRLPIPIEVCPVCGAGIHVTRGFTKINPFRLWNRHDCDKRDDQDNCIQACTCLAGCECCYPPDATCYIMGVGEKFYTAQEFIQEARTMGISKRIPFVPKDLVVGETVIYLAHRKAIRVGNDYNGRDAKYKPGVICSFRPQRIEQLVWESQLDDETRKRLEKRGVTPVPVTDGDPDHAPRGR